MSLLSRVSLLARNKLRSLKSSRSSISSFSTLLHLQGRPPVVDPNAGTFASFYYKNIRDFDTPTKDHIVAFGQDERFTVGAFDRQVCAYALGFLDSLGLSKESKIAVWMSDEVEHLVVRYAAALIGVTVVEVDPSISSESLLTILKNEECRVLFASPRYAGQNRLEELGKVFATELSPALKEGSNLPIQSKRLRNLKFLVCSSVEFEDGILRFCDLPVFGNDGTYEQDDIAAVQSYLAKSDTVTVYYTPSTNGFTKSGHTSHSQLLSSASTAAKSLSLTPSDVLVTTAPYYSTLGLAAGPLAAASVSAKYVLPNKTFDASKTLLATGQQKATVLVVLAEHVDALKTELAKDEAKPEAKRLYNLSTVKRGVVIGAKSDSSVGSVTLKAMSAL